MTGEIHEPGGKHRRELPEGIEGAAVFSEDGRYRYVLTRGWDPWPEPRAVFVGLNPSIAKATVDDPTVQKCWWWAREWGFNSFAMLNVYAYRATDPKHLQKIDDPVGPCNDAFLTAYSCSAQCVIAAWGRRKTKRQEERCDHVRDLLSSISDLYCLGTNSNGSPKHPVRLAASTTRERWHYY